MIDIEYYIDLEGNEFMPKKITWPKYVSIVSMNNKNDISKHTNIKRDFGSIRLEVQRNKLFEILDFIQLNKIQFKIEDIQLFLLIEYEYQCNFEFTSLAIQRISSYNIGVSITCFEKCDSYESIKDRLDTPIEEYIDFDDVIKDEK